MGFFTVGNDLGQTKGYTASGSCYQDAKRDIEAQVRAGRTVNVDADTLRNIEYVAGSFDYETRKKLGL